MKRFVTLVAFLILGIGIAVSGTPPGFQDVSLEPFEYSLDVTQGVDQAIIFEHINIISKVESPEKIWHLEKSSIGNLYSQLGSEEWNYLISYGDNNDNGNGLNQKKTKGIQNSGDMIDPTWKALVSAEKALTHITKFLEVNCYSMVKPLNHMRI